MICILYSFIYYWSCCIKKTSIIVISSKKKSEGFSFLLLREERGEGIFCQEKCMRVRCLLPLYFSLCAPLLLLALPLHSLGNVTDCNTPVPSQLQVVCPMRCLSEDCRLPVPTRGRCLLEGRRQPLSPTTGQPGRHWGVSAPSLANQRHLRQIPRVSHGGGVDSKLENNII